jgi:hypothetical protein
MKSAIVFGGAFLLLAALLLTSPYWLFREFSRSDSEELPTWMGAARARKQRLAVILGVLALVVGTLVCVGALRR